MKKPLLLFFVVLAIVSAVGVWYGIPAEPIASRVCFFGLFAFGLWGAFMIKRFFLTKINP